MTRALAVLVLVALAAPAAAAAHASLVRTLPADGAVLARAPRAVRVEFDDSVRAGSANAAVANVTGASVLGGPALVRGRVLTLPLRRSLKNGDYTVRWSIVSNDGHREQGVLAFAVGSGSPAPHAVLGASSSVTWSSVVLRTLYYLGVLAGAGAAVFALLARRALGTRLVRPLAHLLFVALLATFLGASGLVRTAASGTRFDVVLKVAVVVALVGAAAAALAPRYSRLLPLAGACAAALVAAPTLAGHALDRDQPTGLAPLVDVAHIGAAAVWLGGLLSILYVLPRTGADEGERRVVLRRFSGAALAAVCVLGLTGLARALTELRSGGQLWSTSYGRTLLVKTALFVPLLGVGWLNRALLLRAFVRLRRSVSVETVAIGGIVVAVAVLTELRPGREAPRAVATAVVPRVPALPPRDAAVAARELGALALAVARAGGEATVTLVSPEGTGVDGRAVHVDGAAATSCGAGCYRARAVKGDRIRVAVDGRAVVFDLPARAPDARSLLRRVTNAYRSSRTIVFDERLASSPRIVATTRFAVVAPDRLLYRTRGGAAAVVIGKRRWDRDTPRAPWVESQQAPLDVTQPYWSHVTNVHLVAPHVVTFLDRGIPAWFRVTVAGARPARVDMTAAAHFMVDRYVAFDGPVAVSPPSR